MTKPIIVVKVPCKLLYVIQVKEFLIKCSTSWPYLISEFLVAYITIVASDWPRTFLHPRCFCLAYNDQKWKEGFRPHSYKAKEMSIADSGSYIFHTMPPTWYPVFALWS